MTGRPLIRTSTPGIFRRGEGYVLRIRTPEGTQVQRSARTLAEARRLRSELTADLGRGEFQADRRTTFAEYAAHWSATYTGRTAQGIRPVTLAEYRTDLLRAEAHFGHRLLSGIRPSDVKAYAAALATEGLAPATVRRIVAPVKALFATAFEDGVIRTNPAAGVRLATPRATSPDDDTEGAKALTPAELAAVIENTPAGWQRLMVRLTAETGMRVSEVLGLQWGHVDGQVVHVRQRARHGQLDRPKSSGSRRDIPLARDTARALAAHRLAAVYSGDAHPVFPTATGRVQHTSNTRRWLNPAMEVAGVPWAGWHSLRHTAASRWLLAGVSIAQVSRLLGHADAAFTLRVYISVLPTDLPDGDTLAAALGLP